MQAGVLLGELDHATQPYGLAVPAGIVTRTGIAGLTLGGGLGWLMRKYGLTIDQLLSVDLIIAEGERVKASETEKRRPLLGCTRRRRQLRHRHSRVGEDESAFHGRHARFTFNINGNAYTTDGFDAERRWARDYWSALAPYHTSVYVNFLVTTPMPEDIGFSAAIRRLKARPRPVAPEGRRSRLGGPDFTSGPSPLNWQSAVVKHSRSDTPRAIRAARPHTGPADSTAGFRHSPSVAPAAGSPIPPTPKGAGPLGSI